MHIHKKLLSKIKNYANIINNKIYTTSFISVYVIFCPKIQQIEFCNIFRHKTQAPNTNTWYMTYLNK